MKRLTLLSFLILAALTCTAQYTHQDTLRGSNGRGRDWWDVMKYDLKLEIHPTRKIIKGSNAITFRVIGTPKDSMQIDLQAGMELVGPATLNGHQIYPKDGNVCWLIKPAKNYEVGKVYTIYLAFEGTPREAKNPPWEGGLIWSKDSIGRPWFAVACQGLGASSWWPCKDYQGDEPDSGTNFKLIKEYGEVISNGRVTDVTLESFLGLNSDVTHERECYLYHLSNPINTYGVSFYIGDYAHWHDTLHGEKGILDLDFYPLSYNEAKARKHWAVTKDMLRCYEYWMGPYPFYEDGYKLVEAPYAGMEHQSAIAYGNEYKMGFKGWDRGGTGIGLSFDEIIIHESAHEWWGNNITAQDPADNWIHEGFATYTESLYVEWIKGKDSALMFTKAQWGNIRNDRPVIGDYGVNNEGSADRYAKGAAVVHMVRMMLNDDKKFRQLLRGLNRDFYHEIVTSKQVEEYIAKYVGKDLRTFFELYLRATNKPRLEWYVKDGVLHYRWGNVVPGFMAPVQLITGGKSRYFTTDADWGSVKVGGVDAGQVKVIAAGWYGVVEVEF